MDNVCNRCLFSIPSKVEMAEEQEYLRSHTTTDVIVYFPENGFQGIVNIFYWTHPNINLSVKDKRGVLNYIYEDLDEFPKVFEMQRRLSDRFRKLIKEMIM